MPNSQLTGIAEFPEVVGFELPATDLRGAQDEDQIAVIMLSTAPSREWIAAFLEQAERFKAAHQLTDIRILGSQITLIGLGQFADARTLTASAKLLVQNTAQIRMHERLRHRSGPSEPAPESLSTKILQQGDQRLRDVATVAAIPNVQEILAEVLRMTGMRCAAVARVTDTRWTACAVYDLLEFGLKPGQDLVLEMTICNEIRMDPRTVAFEQASVHPIYAQHPIPAQYGFESYLSVPIWTPQQDFFGTLCALDPKPALLDLDTVSAVEAFARQIGQQL